MKPLAAQSYQVLLDMAAVRIGNIHRGLELEKNKQELQDILIELYSRFLD